MVAAPRARYESLQYLWAEAAEDGRTINIAIILAILVHALLFAIHLPEVALGRSTQEKPKMFVVRPIDFKPPVSTPLEIPRRRERRIPVPDPTPDAPEPVLSNKPPTAAFDLPLDLSLVTIPAAPAPLSTAPIPYRPEMTRPVRISGVEPKYTEVARQARVEGVVILQAVIDKTGSVRDIEVLKPLRLGLDEAAVQAIATWRFDPAKLDDRPIDVIYNLTVRFGLQ